MNARSLKKKLRKNQRNTFWGNRAFLKLRIPLSYLPVPPPPEPKPLEGWNVSYTNHLIKDDTIILSVVSNYTHKDNFIDGRHISSYPEEVIFDILYVSDETIKFACAFKYNYTTKQYLPLDETELQWCKNQYEFNSWHEKFCELQGELGQRILNPYDAGAKTYYIEIKDDCVCITYSVKPFYPNRVKRFCSELKRTSKWLKQKNIPYRIL